MRDADAGRFLLVLREFGLAMFLLALCVFLAVGKPVFLHEANLLGVLTASAITGIYAAGETLVVIGGAIDLSIAGIGTVAGVVAGKVVAGGGSVFLAVVAGLLTGLTAGAVNVVIVTRLRVEPLVATLGTLSVLTGLALILTNANPIFDIHGVGFLGADHVAGVQTPVIFMLGVFVVLAFVLTQTVAGLRLRAVGGNIGAARRAGIRPERYRWAMFTGAGLCSAIAGLVTLGQISTAEPVVSGQDVFEALTAVALAGVLFTGGRGSYAKLFVTSVLLATIQDGLTILDVAPFYSYVTTGVLLIAAVWADGALSRSIDNRRRFADEEVAP